MGAPWCRMMFTHWRSTPGVAVAVHAIRGVLGRTRARIPASSVNAVRKSLLLQIWTNFKNYVGTLLLLLQVAPPLDTHQRAPIETGKRSRLHDDDAIVSIETIDYSTLYSWRSTLHWYTENIRKNTKFHENGILRHARKRWIPGPFSKWKCAVRA